MRMRDGKIPLIRVRFRPTIILMLWRVHLLPATIKITSSKTYPRSKRYTIDTWRKLKQKQRWSRLSNSLNWMISKRMPKIILTETSWSTNSIFCLSIQASLQSRRTIYFDIALVQLRNHCGSQISNNSLQKIFQIVQNVELKRILRCK